MAATAGVQRPVLPLATAICWRTGHGWRWASAGSCCRGGEELRYGPRKAGYHGGASPAEAVIPLIVLSAGREDVVPGWRSEDQQTLFEMPAVAPDVLLVTPGVPAGTTAAQPTRPPLVDALLGSELYQQRRGGRGALDDDRVAALLTVLVQSGGRAAYETLAAKAGIAAFRIAGTVTALRRLLQVEGYPVIEIDPDGTTVLLNAPLLASSSSWTFRER